METPAFDELATVQDQLADVVDAIEDDEPWEDVRVLLDKLCSNPAFLFLCRGCEARRKE